MKKLFFLTFCLSLFFSCENNEINDEFEIANLIASSCDLTNSNRITTDESSLFNEDFTPSDHETCNGNIGDQNSCIANRIARALRTELNNTRAFQGRQLLNREIIEFCGVTPSPIETFGIENNNSFDYLVPAEIGNTLYQITACEMKSKLDEQPALPNPDNQLYIISDIFIAWDIGFGSAIYGWTYTIERLTFAD